MANPEHVAVVLRGKEAIAEWWGRNPGVQLHLGQADLRGADLEGADLRAAQLQEANLNDAILAEANLSGADLTGVALFNANLDRADLSHGDLSSANLADASLWDTNLFQAKLTGARVARGILAYAKLGLADLSGADLTATNLLRADLKWANLTGAMLYFANLNHVELEGTDLSDAAFGATPLAHLDLSRVIGLATVNHEMASSVGVDTLIRSFRGAGNKLTSELGAFFEGAGVPRELLDALPGIVAEVKYHSCFISYGQPDLAFATRLREDLVGKGVSCWVYEMDKTVGEQTWHEIEQKLEEYDKMVVVCSIDALMRGGVKKEIDKQIDKNPNKLVPVSLDNRWTQPGFEVQWAGRDLKPFLCERNRADFSGWESDSHRYQKALDELLKGLKRRAD